MLDESEVKRIVQLTVREMKREDLLRDAEDVAYREISDRLKSYYEEGAEDPALSEALKDLQSDKYFDTVFLFYAEGFKVEAIAELLEVDVRTVTRNKKRLCLALYLQLQD